MHNVDQEASQINYHEQAAIGAVIQEDSTHMGMSGAIGVSLGLKCPYEGCECGDFTHIVDVVWEPDPSEGDRRWVRMEVRCEMGRGYLLLIRNHAGHTRLEYKLIDGEVSPFADGARW